MRLIWQDVFDREPGSAPDPASWNLRTGNWKPGVQEYIEGAARIVRGFPGASTNYLAVTASRTGSGYTSARLDTRGKREFSPPVLITASISMPAGAQGVVPAFWTLGSNPADPENWPQEGEIDIVEWPSNHPVNLGEQLGRASLQTVHGPAIEAPAKHEARGRTTILKIDQSIGFHIYSLYWLPHRVYITVDGTRTLDISADEFARTGGDWTPLSGTWPHYLLFTMAVDTGMTPDATKKSPFPATMLVDWVRAYAL